MPPHMAFTNPQHRVVKEGDMGNGLSMKSGFTRKLTA